MTHKRAYWLALTMIGLGGCLEDESHNDPLDSPDSIADPLRVYEKADSLSIVALPGLSGPEPQQAGNNCVKFSFEGSDLRFVAIQATVVSDGIDRSWELTLDEEIHDLEFLQVGPSPVSVNATIEDSGPFEFALFMLPVDPPAATRQEVALSVQVGYIGNGTVQWNDQSWNCT